MDLTSLSNGAHPSGCPRGHSRAGAFVVRLVWAADRVALVVVAGEVDYFTSACLRDVVETALSAGAELMIIDLTDVTFLDASGLSVAVLAGRSLGVHQTVIVCPAPRLACIFRVTALDRVLTICETREEAFERITDRASSADRGRRTVGDSEGVEPLPRNARPANAGPYEALSIDSTEWRTQLDEAGTELQDA